MRIYVCIGGFDYEGFDFPNYVGLSKEEVNKVVKIESKRYNSYHIEHWENGKCVFKESLK